MRKPDINFVCLNEYELIFTGYLRRQDRETNRTRHLMSHIQAFAGMGGGSYTPPDELWPLSIDEENKKRFITTMAMAKELFKDFM